MRMCDTHSVRWLSWFVHSKRSAKKDEKLLFDQKPSNFNLISVALQIGRTSLFEFHFIIVIGKWEKTGLHPERNNM